MGASDRESTKDLDQAWGGGDEAEDLRTSTPDISAVDSAWGEEEDDEDEDEAPEAPLPDERLDPVAYAAAKKALEEREAARRDRRKARAEEKKQRQKLRAQDARQKQKSKKKGGRSSAKAEAEQKEREERRLRKENAAEARRVMAREREAAEEAALAEQAADEASKRGARRVVRPTADDGRAEVIAKSTPPWTVTALVIAVLVAAAVLFAVTRR